MSLGRSVAKFIAATLFTSFLALFVMAISLQSLTSYATLSSLSKDLFLQQADKLMPAIESACAGTDRLEFELQGEKISLPCSEANDPGSLADKVFQSIYYRNYTCTLLGCVRQPQAFASAFGNKMFSDIAIFSAVIAVISGMAMVYMLDRKVRGLGASLIFVGLNYFAILAAKSLIPADFAGLLNPLFSSLEAYFLYIMAAGIALLLAGVYTKR